MRASVNAKATDCSISSGVAGDDHWPPKSLLAVLERCLRRASSWPAPPNWSRHDWAQVTHQVANIALCDALRDRPTHADIPLEAFVHQRLMSALRTKARREYRYGARSTPLTAEMEQSLPAHPNGTAAQSHGANGQDSIRQTIHDLLASLPARSVKLLREIFYEGRTVAELSQQLHINRRTLNSQKLSALALLRCALCADDTRYARCCAVAARRRCSRSQTTGPWGRLGTEPGTSAK